LAWRLLYPSSKPNARAARREASKEDAKMIFKRGMLVGLLMLTSLAPLAGCNAMKSATTDEGAAQTAPAQPSAAAAPAAPTAQEEVASATPANVTVDVNLKQAPPPPALRIENPGPAPSVHHVWMNGFYRYDTVRVSYVWVPGFWQDRNVVATIAPPPPRREIIPPCADGYAFVPGFWAYNGRSYVWYGGHFETRRVGYVFSGPRYVFVNGRYEFRNDGWVRHVDEHHDRVVRVDHHDERVDHRDERAREEAGRRAEEQKRHEQEQQAQKDHDRAHAQPTHGQPHASTTTTTTTTTTAVKTTAKPENQAQAAKPAAKVTATATTTNRVAGARPASSQVVGKKS
jgi:hypothetical protein